jgi:hypothetical protein
VAQKRAKCVKTEQKRFQLPVRLRGRTIVAEENSFKARPPAVATAQISLKANAIRPAGERKAQRIRRAIVHAGLIGFFTLLQHRERRRSALRRSSGNNVKI